jgi:(2Fe-2S) ferredoxin
MEKPDKHLLVCASFRTSGEPKGVCHKKGAIDLLGYLEMEMGDRDLGSALVSSTGCLKVCDNGPVMAIYPDNIWCGGVDSEEAIDDILDALEEGDPVPEKYLI